MTMSSREEFAPRDRRLNVHPLERLLSVALGACLLQSGLQRSGAGGCLRLLLGSALTYRGVRGFCPVYDAWNIDTRSTPAKIDGDWQRIEASVVIPRPPNELYDLWRDFTQMPSLLSHVEKVDILDDQRSRWTVVGPLGARLELVSRIEEDEQDRRIAWCSTPQASVQTRGAVEFLKEGEEATRVRVELSYLPPGGGFGRVLERIFGPEAQSRLSKDLERFKERLETGAGDGNRTHDT